MVHSAQSLIHILNGDATKRLFEQSPIKGNIAVWREMLCEGPTLIDLDSDHFWEMRETYFSKAYKVSKEVYQKKTKSEFEKIKDYKHYEEVVLWFEYDLFCQVNLIALCSYFFKRNEGIKISLVCTGDEKSDNRLSGLGEFEAEDYRTLFESRKNLNREDLLFCHKIWELYCSRQALLLQEGINKHLNNKFKYLNPALKAHLRRFPSAKNGLNEIEQKIIDLIDTGKYSKRKIVGEMLRWQKWYGFGDLQYFYYLEELGLFYQDQEGILYLNETGKKVQSEVSSCWKVKEDDTIFGGALKRDFVFDTEKDILTKVSD